MVSSQFCSVSISEVVHISHDPKSLITIGSKLTAWYFSISVAILIIYFARAALNFPILTIQLIFSIDLFLHVGWIWCQLVTMTLLAWVCRHSNSRCCRARFGSSTFRWSRIARSLHLIFWEDICAIFDFTNVAFTVALKLSKNEIPTAPASPSTCPTPMSSLFKSLARTSSHFVLSTIEVSL